MQLKGHRKKPRARTGAAQCVQRSPERSRKSLRDSFEKALDAIVIPAKAGIPLRDIECLPGSWIPAAAGITAFSEFSQHNRHSAVIPAFADSLRLDCRYTFMLPRE